MKRYFKSIIKVCIASYLCTATLFASSQPPEQLTTPELIKALQSGGHIMYMRHGATDIMQKDKDRSNLDHCSYQRNLSKTGRDELKQIGLAIQKLKIPIGDVLSSPYCRTRDTAKLVYGDYKVEMNLQFSISKNRQQATELGELLHKMMLNSEPGSKNEVFVGHTANLKDGLGIWPKPEGVVAVFQKKEGEIVFKGMIKPNEWPHEH